MTLKSMLTNHLSLCLIIHGMHPGPGSSTAQKCNDKQCLGLNRHPKKCIHFIVQHFGFPFELHAHGISKSIGYGVQFIRCLIK